MSHLFSATRIGQLALDNRIVIAPMCQYSADEGKATSWHRIHLGQLAFSGAGHGGRTSGTYLAGGSGFVG